jgi:hypothetical protein
MKRRIKHNDLTAWFLRTTLRCQLAMLKAAGSFLNGWMNQTRKDSKRQASSLKRQASSRGQMTQRQATNNNYI